MQSLSGELTNSSWNEETYAEGEGARKLTRATVEQDVAGDVVGKAHVEWLMSYGDDGTARFVGFQQLEGAINGRQGSVVLESFGGFDGTEATWIGRIVEGSGTGGWAGMHGEGRFRAPHGSTASFTLECSFD